MSQEYKDKLKELSGRWSNGTWQLPLAANTEEIRISLNAAAEEAYWRRNTSFGLIFGLGVLVGLIVGAIIVYQILYSDVSDHLPEYATMKAMGYSDRFVVGIIVQESVLLAALAFVPSLVLAIGLYAVLANSTSLLIAMTAQRAVAVFALTLTMAAGSGWLATGKLRRLDPADIF